MFIENRASAPTEVGGSLPSPLTREGAGSRPPRVAAKVSVIVPAYNESQNVDVLASAVGRVLENQDYELLFVDDGSRDDTFGRIEALARANPKVRGLGLSRNFGHQAALLAGLHHAIGDVIITMDADLQHPPAIIPALIDRWRQGAHIVHTLRDDPPDFGRLKRAATSVFYRLSSVLCGVPLVRGMSDFRLLDRRVVDELKKLREARPFLRGVFTWMGYESAVVSYTAQGRHAGPAKYTWRKLARLAADGMFSFSTVPLRMGLPLGAIIVALSVVELWYVGAAGWAGGALPGWTAVGLMGLLLGMLFLLVGIQGVYIARLYERAVGRPAFIIERFIGEPIDKPPKRQDVETGHGS